MIFDKQDNTTIITQEKTSVVELVKKLYVLGTITLSFA